MQIELAGAESGLATHGLAFSLNFSTAARVRGKISREALEAALERLRLIHPMMAVRLDPGANGGKPCFTTENVPPIPVQVIERHTNDQWVKEAERQIAIPSNYRTGPLFRVSWLKGEEVSDLVLISDHITADGLAGIFALRDLLRLLAEPDAFIEPCIPEKYADLVPPEMRRMILERTSGGEAEPPRSPHGPRQEQILPPLSILPIEFSQAETGALVARCKAEAVTVQSALGTAFAIPFAERQPEQPMRWIESPYNLRNRMARPLDNVYGVFISLVFSRLDCNPGRARWEIAHEMSRGLKAVTDEQLFSIPVVMIHVAEHPLNMPVVNFNYDLSISNLGQVKIPQQYGDLTLESIFAPTMNVDSPAHRILGVTTFGGQMRCTFTSRDPGALELVRRSREILAEMIA